jgi:hypothetical protein
VIDWSITTVFRPAAPSKRSQKKIELGVTDEIVFPRDFTLYCAVAIVAALPDANAEQLVVVEVI